MFSPIERFSIRQIRTSSVLRNIIALYGTQIAAYIFPLLTIPYLARVLGPFCWGLVAFSQALGIYLSIVVEFGFQFSATRKIARIKEDRDQLSCVVAGVMGAKILLALPCLGILPLLPYLIHSIRGNETILWMGAVAGIAQGFSMLWFYLGIEEMRIPAVLDIAAKGCAAAGVFIFVHSPDDAWKVLGLQSICYSLASVILLAMAYRRIPFRIPTFSGALSALAESTQMFLFRGAVSFYTTANAIILGAVSTPLSVGLFSGVERPMRALLNLFSPINQSLYPRISNLVSSDRAKAISLLRISFAIMTCGATIICVTTFVLAPVIVRILLGEGYEAATPVVRVLCFLLPVIAVSNVLGIQWMLPLGMDRMFNGIIISAGLLNLTLGVWLASWWGHMGMAYAAIAAEMLVSFSIWFVLSRRNLNPIASDFPAAKGDGGDPVGLIPERPLISPRTQVNRR